MNCDQVFDILTRGPFPTGQDCDQWVEQHLSRCRECRRLAEALQPALELFEESVTPEEGRNLPAYWGALLDGGIEETQAATCRAPRTKRRAVGSKAPARVPGRRKWVTAGRLAAAVVLGVLLGAALGRIDTIDHATPASLARLDAASGDVKTDSTWATVGGFDFSKLAPACLTSQQSESSADRPHLSESAATAEGLQIQWARLACCTDCHSSAAEAVASHVAATKIAMSCQHCHRP